MTPEYKARRAARRAARKAERKAAKAHPGVPLHGRGGEVIGYGYDEASGKAAMAAGVPIIRTDESEDRLHIASEAAFVILSGLRQGWTPVKVAWLSALSNEPVGLTVIGPGGGHEDYTGILVRYEQGTNGLRIVKVPEIVQGQLGGDVAFFGDPKFGMLDFGEADRPEIFSLVAKLLAVREADANIAV